jgi:hypothetical protein
MYDGRVTLHSQLQLHFWATAIHITSLFPRLFRDKATNSSDSATAFILLTEVSLIKCRCPLEADRNLGHSGGAVPAADGQKGRHKRIVQRRTEGSVEYAKQRNV